MNLLPTTKRTKARNSAAAPSRFQVQRQSRAQIYTAEFSTNSMAEAVGVFLNLSPTFEGGGIRIWNFRERRATAIVKWHAERTDFGFPVRQRVNVFYGRRLALLARQIEERKRLCASETRETEFIFAV